MGILASGTASLLPKEAFDKGWRKAVVLIVGIITMGFVGYFLAKAEQYGFAAGVAGGIVTLVAAYLKINLRQHAKEIQKYLPVITKAIENLGGEKEKTE